MWMFALALPLLMAMSNGVNSNADVIEVDIESGRIRGKRSLTLFNEKPYYSFRGIPYAQAPIKDLRFKVSTKAYKPITTTKFQETKYTRKNNL